jgi:hypothetical protein
MHAVDVVIFAAWVAFWIYWLAASSHVTPRTHVTLKRLRAHTHGDSVGRRRRIPR